MGWIRNQVLELVDQQDFIQEMLHPTLVVMEGFSFASRGKHTEIGGMAWMVRYALWERGIDYVVVTPGQLKKFALGKGVGEKDQITKEVLKRFGLDAADDNQADAIVLCHIGAALLNAWEPTMQAQREVLQELRKNEALTRGRI